MTSEQDFPLASVDAEPPAGTRPLYWSLRREIWENRSVWLAPLIVAAVVLFATLLGTMGLPGKMRNLPADPARAHVAIVKPFSMAPAPIMATAFLVGFFFAVDALYGERRDRSILFWKSLPVSDRTAVLAKFLIPFAVLPAIAFVLSVIVLVILFFWSSAVLIVSGTGPVRLWSELRPAHETVIMLYGLIVHSLWLAPVYAWLLLLSAWARRAPLLWAVLPPLLIAMFERMAFGSAYFAALLRYRWLGAMGAAFQLRPDGKMPLLDHVSLLTPLRFLSTPGLWAGLLFAAALLVAAVRLRRMREPI